MKNVEEWKNKDWILWKFDDCPINEFDFTKFAEANPDPNEDEWPCVIAEQYFLDEKSKAEGMEEWKTGLPEYRHNEIDNVPKISLLEKIWMDVLCTPIIPFDLNERHKQLAHAYEKLSPYIEAHEAMKKETIEANEE